MCKSEILKRMFSVATLAMMFSVGTVYAQTDKSAAGTTKENQTGKMTPSGQNETSSGTAAPGGSGAAARSGTAGAAGSGSLSKSDQKMMSDIARSNIAEIETGKLAQSKSQNEQVKAFAQKMIDDHGAAQQELQQLAQAKGVTLPSEPDVKHKAMAKVLAGLSGDAFDRRYIAQGGLADHKATHKLLQKVQKQAADPELKAYAAKIQPTVDQHLTMAQQTRSGKSGTSGSSGTAGSSGTSDSTTGAAAGSSTGSTTDSTKGAGSSTTGGATGSSTTGGSTGSSTGGGTAGGASK